MLEDFGDYISKLLQGNSGPLQGPTIGGAPMQGVGGVYNSPIGPTATGSPMGGGGGLDFAGVMPILQGLMGGQQTQGPPPVQQVHGGVGGAQLNFGQLPAQNPASIRKRM